MISFVNMKKKTMVSIIITSKNEEKVINRLFKSIFKQTYKNFEVILVDNNSTDNTKEIAKKYKVKFHNFGPERSAQRNLGAKQSAGEFLLFLDADMELTTKVIEDCVDKVLKEKLEGIVIPEESKWVNFWGEVKAFERSFYNENGDPVTDAARFFSKKVFQKIGGYDETITGPEDWDLPDRVREVGYHIGRSSQRIYHHEQEVSLLDLFKKKFYYGLNAHKYLSKHDIPVFSPKTIFFLRPLFYKNWIKLIRHPILSMAMSFMLLVELVGGGMGYLVGRMVR